MGKWLSAILLAVLAAVSCSREDNSGDMPMIVLATGETMVVPAEGGRLSISYGVLNAVADGSITASSDADWMSGPEYTSGTSLEFVLEPNSQTQNRSSVITLRYRYGGGGSEVEAQMNVIQSAAGHVLEATEFSGIYYDTLFGKNGEYNYYIWLSDKPSVDNYPQAGGTYYLFDIYSTAPENPAAPLPPAGTYTLGKAGETSEMTFSNKSHGFATTEDGSQYIFNSSFKAGTLTVDMDGDNIVMQAELTDKDGAFHLVTYYGPARCSIYEEEPEDPGVIGDVDIRATYAEALYYGGDASVMQVQFAFTDMKVDEFGAPTPPGSILTLVTYMPFDADGRIDDGVYEVTASAGDEFSIEAGKWLVDGIWATGSYVTVMNGEGTAYGLVSDGVMEVSVNSGVCDIECSLTMDNGNSISCVWSGPLEVFGVPGPFSTLTGDYTLDLSGADNLAAYYGDYYGNGTAQWRIQLVAPSGDGVDIELVAEGSPFAEGLPEGVYTASASSVPEPGHYVPGSMSMLDGALSGTLYLGDKDSMGQYTSYAPAVSGDLDIRRLEGGEYSISFVFTDDRGNVWDGQWAGNL